MNYSLFLDFRKYFILPEGSSCSDLFSSLGSHKKVVYGLYFKKIP